MNFRNFLPVVFALALAVSAVAAPGPRTIVIDDFENGIGGWTRNDQMKSENPALGVVLVDIIATHPAAGGLPGSKGAALLTFKDARNSWASVSHRVDGAAWAAIGADRLSFWLDADGAQPGTEVVLRGRYSTPAGIREETFNIPVRLNVRSWRRVTIPLNNIRNENGPLLGRLRDVYLMQFVQHGTWKSRFFAVDQIQVEGSGTPLPTSPVEHAAAAAVAAAVAANPAPGEAGAVQINVDYLKTQGRIRTSANISVGSTLPSAVGSVSYPLIDNEGFRKAVQVLHPRFVRLDVASHCDMTDSLNPTFDFARLVASVREVRAAGAEPLLALSNDPSWGLDEHAYAVYCLSAAKAVSAGSVKPVRYYELPTGATTTDDATAIALYNRGRAALKSLSPLNRVGGIGASSGRTGTLAALLARAGGLDFLSLQYYGASIGTPEAEVLFQNARDLASLRSAAVALDKSRWSRAPIYLTQANLNSARAEGSQLPADGRTVIMASAAWWASFMGNSSRLADEVFHNDAAKPEWGLLDENARAYPAYYTLWMWNTFFPPGSERVQATSNSNRVVVFGANTTTAHNLLLANVSDAALTVKVGIRGFPILHSARSRVLDDPQRGVVFVDLPKSPFQTLVLKPYSVAVLQFTEPALTPAAAR